MAPRPIAVRTTLFTVAATALSLVVGTFPAGAAGGASAPPTARPAPVSGTAASGGAVIIELRNQHQNLNLRTQGVARRAEAHADQQPLIADIRAHGGTQITQLVSVNAIGATISAAEVKRLARNASVKRIIPDETIQVQPAASPATAPPADLSSALCPTDPTKPLVEPEALTDIHAYSANPKDKAEANKIATGQGVLVAIDGMNELAGNPNFIRPDGSHVVIDAPDPSADASDDEAYGDASSVAGQGTVVYDYSKELPFSGLPSGCTFTLRGDAPGASLVDASQIDTPESHNGFIDETEAQVVAGIDNAVIIEHADVLSESYGYTPSPGFYAIHYAANDAAIAAGVTVVVSSGDSGPSGTVSSPASDPLAIEVGATNTLRLLAQAYGYTSWTNDNITPLSSGGTTPNNKLPDLVAPGYGGEAACNPNGSGCPTNTLTEAFGGTSESCPLVAGAAADVIQAYRDSHAGASPTPALVKQLLVSTATDVDSPADQQGGGLLNVYAAVRAAEQMPGATSPGTNTTQLVAGPGQLDVTGAGGTSSDQDVNLYNTSAQDQTVLGHYRALGASKQLGSTVTEAVSAPDPSLPVPAEGAPGATPITFTVPKGLARLTTQMIWPDATNGAILSYDLIDPHGGLTQISYDYGTPSRFTGGIGSVPDFGQTQVADPVPGTWTAIPRWANGRAHLQEPPNVPGTYTGNLSFRALGAYWVTRPASGPIDIPARSSADVPLAIPLPATPGDHPESVQFVTNTHRVLSLPVARRTLIDTDTGGKFTTVITGTVGRGIGQISTFNVQVPAGQTDLTVRFTAPDANPDNGLTYYLVNPSGTLVAEDRTPTTTLQGIGSTTPTGKAALVVPSPAAGLWEIDVKLNLTESGQEFTQSVAGTAAFNQTQVTPISGVPTSTGTTISPSSPRPVSLMVVNTSGVGRSFSLTSANGDLSGGAAATPVYVPAGTSALITTTILPIAATSTVVAGTINVVSNDSVSSGSSVLKSQTFAQIPYTYTVGS